MKYVDLLKDKGKPKLTDDFGSGSSVINVESDTGKAPKMTFTDWYNATKTQIQTDYDRTISDAELERRRAVADASNAYNHNRATYGSNAAALSSGGLTGSGFSQYLDSKAYAQMRGDINAAERNKQIAVNNAEGVRSNAESKANATYLGYLDQQEANRMNIFNSLYDNAGSLSNIDIDNLAAMNGFTPDQVTALKTGRLERIKASLDSSDYYKEDLDSLFDVSIPEEKALYDEYLGKLKDTTGKFDESSFYVKDENGKDVLMEPSTALETIANLKANGVDTTEAEKMYKKYYRVGLHANGGGVKYTSVGSKFKPEKKGDNFKVVNTDYAGNERTFKVENGGKVEDNDPVLNVSRSVIDNQVFYYNGAIYLKYDGSVYKINGRSNPDEYNHLLELFVNDFN